MLTVEDAETALILLKNSGVRQIRLCFPYSEDVMRTLRQRGYLPVLEHNAWNSFELVIASPRVVNQAPDYERNFLVPEDVS